jgi:hypothetical protein
MVAADAFTGLRAAKHAFEVGIRTWQAIEL